MYVKIDNNQITFPYSATDLIRANKNVSWPNTRLPDSLLAEYNVFPVIVDPEPSYNTMTEVLVRETPIKKDEVWTQAWRVERKPLEQAIEVIRERRNLLLTESDWTQVADVPVDKNAWADYRQKLRDIPKQDNFPWDIIWPVAP